MVEADPEEDLPGRSRSDSRQTFYTTRSRTPSLERLDMILQEHDLAHAFLQSANKNTVKSGVAMGIDPLSRYPGMNKAS